MKTQDDLIITVESPILVLARVSRGYATDSQCNDAISRESELVSQLALAYEAMLSMRSMLARCDISILGGSLKQTIDSTAVLLYPPTKGKGMKP